MYISHKNINIYGQFSSLFTAVVTVIKLYLGSLRQRGTNTEAIKTVPRHHRTLYPAVGVRVIRIGIRVARISRWRYGRVIRLEITVIRTSV